MSIRGFKTGKALAAFFRPLYFLLKKAFYNQSEVKRLVLTS